MVSGYVGRFAPSPTGPLHAGSLVAALASWLDARAHHGQWLVRIEDVDQTRSQTGLDRVILQQLAACGLHSDLPPLYQSQRSPLYQAALQALINTGLAYPCGCSRREVELAQAASNQQRARHSELIYPGTCRHGLNGKAARSWRLRSDIFKQNSLVALVPPSSLATVCVAPVQWFDRRLGNQAQDVASDVGDFVLKRADGGFAYQLAVVVDDGAQGISDVVRGADLADNTARQILLQRALQLPTPRYLHTPLVLAANGDKLSKQNGAQPFDTGEPLAALNQAATVLGLTPQTDAAQALDRWCRQWQQRWCQPAGGPA